MVYDRSYSITLNIFKWDLHMSQLRHLLFDLIEQYWAPRLRRCENRRPPRLSMFALWTGLPAPLLASKKTTMIILLVNMSGVWIQMCFFVHTSLALEKGLNITFFGPGL